MNKNKLIQYVFIVVGIFFGVTVNSVLCDDGINLVQNPGFESSELQGWYTKLISGKTAVFIDKMNKYSGDVSLCIEKEGSKFFPIDQINQNIGIPDSTYRITISGYVKSEDAKKSVIDVIFYNEKGKWISHKWAAFIEGTHDWQEYTDTIEVPEGCKKMTLSLQSYGAGKVWFDDLKVIPYTENVKSSVKEAVTIISTCTEHDTEKIKSAFDLIKNLPQEQVLEELIVYLGSDTPTIRRAAIFTTYKNKWNTYEKAIEPLIHLLSHKEDFTRGMAAIALGELKTNRAFNQIAKLLENDRSSYVRRCVAYALGVLGNKEVIPYLTRALNDSNELVQNNARYALELLEKQ